MKQVDMAFAHSSTHPNMFNDADELVALVEQHLNVDDVFFEGTEEGLSDFPEVIIMASMRDGDDLLSSLTAILDSTPGLVLTNISERSNDVVSPVL